ncbi:MAG TPA: hypothetical protein VN428_06655 [Bryobacteraceae bacterium]|nr:hypothetical protein [Bryobacteraceae bacterium]
MGDTGTDAKNEDTGQTENPRRSKAELLTEVIRKVEEKVVKGELKPTLGDLVRLWQLERELGEEQPKEIKVQWVDPADPESVVSGE